MFSIMTPHCDGGVGVVELLHKGHHCLLSGAPDAKNLALPDEELYDDISQDSLFLLGHMSSRMEPFGYPAIDVP